MTLRFLPAMAGVLLAATACAGPQAPGVGASVWEGVDLSADSAVSSRFPIFLDSLAAAPEAAGTSMVWLLDRAAAEGHDALCVVASQAETLLGSPDAVWADDSLLLAVADYGSRAKVLTDTERMRYELVARSLRLNAVGTEAPDFDMTLRSGAPASLRSMAARSPQTVVAFYDPECETCSEVLNLIAEDPDVRAKADEGLLTLLAVYPIADDEAWAEHPDKVPAPWVDAMSLTDVEDTGEWRLPSTPTLFVLDSERRIVLKNPTPAALLRALR